MYRWASTLLLWTLLAGYTTAQEAAGPNHDAGRIAAAPRSAGRDRGGVPEHMGSPYVPLDSWVYGAFERLAALGHVRTAFLGLRPWTRLECARLLQEAADSLAKEGVPPTDDAGALYRSLSGEFAAESRKLLGDRNLDVELESLYTRWLQISGPPLADSYHFGQTVINDYGRPYGRSANLQGGFSGHGEAGPVTVYVRGEYQQAPRTPPLSAAVRQLIANLDAAEPLPAMAIPARQQFRLLEAYVALNLGNTQVAFGKQSLWWGPDRGGPLMFSNNAEPFYMLRLSRVSPMLLPGPLRRLGPVRWESFLGRLEGHRYPAHPYISGQKISFKPTPNLELGFSKITIFAGGNVPISWRGYYRSVFSVGDHPGQTQDPGDRRGGFDFSYRLPKLRNWLVLYSDSLVDDDPSPLAAPRRAAMNPGIYLVRVPGLRRLDFRMEAPYTDVPTGRSLGGRFIYWNGAFRDSHQNKGNLLGNWVGREGRGLQVWSTYWISGESTVQFGYRRGRVASDFVPDGGKLQDVSIRATISHGRNLLLDAWLQHETWTYAALAPGRQTNIAFSLQLTYRPHWRLSR